MIGSATAWRLKHGATRERCWSCPDWPRTNWRAGSGCPARCSCPVRSGKAIRNESRRCHPQRAGCCWWPRPSRPAIRCSCGGRQAGSGSRLRMRVPRLRPGSSTSSAGYGSAIRWPGPRSISWPRRHSSRKPTGPSRWPPTPIPIATGGPGIARTRPPAWTRTLALPWRARPAGRKPAVVREPWRHSWQRAAELTPDPARRAHRALNAAQAKHAVGGQDAALRLLAIAQTGPLDERGQARAELLRARTAVRLDRALLLLKVANRLKLLDAGLASEAYRDAFEATITAGRLTGGGGLRHIAETVLTAPACAAVLAYRRTAAQGAGHVGRPGSRHRWSCAPASVERVPSPGSTRAGHLGLAAVCYPHVSGRLGRRDLGHHGYPVDYAGPAGPERWPCFRPR